MSKSGRAFFFFFSLSWRRCFNLFPFFGALGLSKSKVFRSDSAANPLLSRLATNGDKGQREASVVAGRTEADGLSAPPPLPQSIVRWRSREFKPKRFSSNRRLFLCTFRAKSRANCEAGERTKAAYL